MKQKDKQKIVEEVLKEVLYKLDPPRQIRNEDVQKAISLAISKCEKIKDEEIYNDIGEIYNNLQDDLQLDKTGEEGYKTEFESNKAVRKYTWKVVKRICDKWEKRYNQTLKEDK